MHVIVDIIVELIHAIIESSFIRGSYLNRVVKDIRADYPSLYRGIVFFISLLCVLAIVVALYFLIPGINRVLP